MKYYHKPLVTGGTAVCPINFPSPSLFPIPNQKEVIKSRKQLIYKPNPEVCFSPHEITPLSLEKAIGSQEERESQEPSIWLLNSAH